jgi:MraZ protein
VEEQTAKSAVSARPPLGRYPARLDDKGRLKLPAVFHEYFKTFPDNRLFITSLDGIIGHMYPLSAWFENGPVLDGFKDDPKAKQRLMFNAQDLGAEADIDSQGRVTINSDLRRELNLQGQELHLFAYNNHVQILTEKIYQERRREARDAGRADLEKLEAAGFR